ncbi:unnamed protein product, partial [Symbiodinium microadriaticum]
DWFPCGACGVEDRAHPRRAKRPRLQKRARPAALRFGRPMARSVLATLRAGGAARRLPRAQRLPK